MAKNKAEKFDLPKILTFERKLEPSDALMYAGNWDDIGDESKWKQPIIITPRTSRGTKSHYQPTIHDEKADPNPFEGDDAFLPQNKDTLKVSFTLKIIGNVGEPFSCNAPPFEDCIKSKVNDFKGKDGSGFETLAFRYAYNIANGRFLWRNRVCAEKIITYVRQNDEKELMEFDAHDFSLKGFNKNANNETLMILSKMIRQGLVGNDDYILLTINSYVRLGFGQHVFPSQEMNMGDKKKNLFKLNVNNENQAAIHAVKIGNAIRTIDTWYGDTMLTLTGKKSPKTQDIDITGKEKLPIAVEPYGAVTQRGSAYRPMKNDLYSLLLKWVKDEELSTEDKNFIVANFIRGGLFNGESEKNKE